MHYFLVHDIYPGTESDLHYMVIDWILILRWTLNLGLHCPHMAPDPIFALCTNNNDHPSYIDKMNQETVFPTRRNARPEKTQISLLILTLCSDFTVCLKALGSLATLKVPCKDSDQTADAQADPSLLLWAHMQSRRKGCASAQVLYKTTALSCLISSRTIS